MSSGAAKSVKFERMIARIHEALEIANTEVTWNDRIPDPDNPSRGRQIDVSIRNSGHLTIVECRLHKAPQDVKWIEELIGRRQSLGADAVIAVSASGFTEGAMLKAQRYGVITRDLTTLTVEEIRRWGKVSSVVVNHVQFDNPKLILSCGRSSSPFAPNRQALMDLFYETAHRATLEVFDKLCETAAVDIGLHAEDLILGGRQIHYVRLQAAARRIVQRIGTTAVLAYGVAGEIPLSRDALVEEFGEIMNIEHVDSANIMAVDLSAIDQPVNSVFHSAEVTMSMGVTPELRVAYLGEFRPSLELSFSVTLDEQGANA